MTYIGFALFFAPHFFSLMRDKRQLLIEKIGEGAYKGVYSILTLLGLYLIIAGWSSLPYEVYYEPPKHLKHLNLLLMFVAFVFVLGAYLPSNLLRKVKNPMATGVKLWATGHLLANGDNRSLLLFGSFLAYTVIHVIAVKKQGRARQVPTAVPMYWDIVLILSTILIYGAIFHFHQSWFGVSPLYR
jgi:uncharacterized membrane protein